MTVAENDSDIPDKLGSVVANWEKFAKSDPLWAILSKPGTKGNKWNVDAFFETGRTEIAGVMKQVNEFLPTLSKRRALDFGCGVGRLSRALAGIFNETYGVDISPTMIDLARKFNKDYHNCEFCLNQRNDLSKFDSNQFDLIYSSLTLQHMSPDYSSKYIQEFMRLVGAKGIVIFQLPCRRIDSKVQRLKTLTVKVAKEFLQSPSMEMFAVSREKVTELMNQLHAKILLAEVIPSGSHFQSIRYYATRL
jgi:ubiquinone/menaquinone biosynthesis C-methylase UbiE